MVVQSVREIPTYFAGNAWQGEAGGGGGLRRAIIRAGDTRGILQRSVCVCVCIKSILFCELQVGKFSGQVIIVRVNESRSEYPLSVLRISFPGFY